MIEGVIYRGAVVRVPDLHVVDGRETGLWWEPPGPGCRKGRAPIRAFDVHWTGGENPAVTVVATLRKRGLSTSFTIDNHGEIQQHADLTTVTYDSGKANEWTRGVEVVCKGLAPAHSRHPRSSYVEAVHGKDRRMLRFTPVQMDSLERLARGVCGVLGIPWLFPVDDDGELLTRAMGKAEKDAFSGVLGHYHLTSRKLDPGPLPLRELMTRSCRTAAAG